MPISWELGLAPKIAGNCDFFLKKIAGIWGLANMNRVSNSVIDWDQFVDSKKKKKKTETGIWPTKLTGNWGCDPQ